MKQLIAHDDPRINRTFQGVRQDHLGRDYREAQLENGSTVQIEAPDSRKIEVTGGSFDRNTYLVEMVDEDGTRVPI